MRHDHHHRIDAVLACAVDHLGDLMTDANLGTTRSSAAEISVVRRAVDRAVDRAALLDLLPPTGRDDAHGRSVASVIAGAEDAGRYTAGDDRALLCAVAARLAVVACAMSAQHNAGKRTDADALWRAAGLLSCLSPVAEQRPNYHSVDDRRFAEDCLAALTMLGYDQTRDPVGWAQDVADKVRQTCAAVDKTKRTNEVMADIAHLRFADVKDDLDSMLAVLRVAADVIERNGRRFINPDSLAQRLRSDAFLWEDDAQELADAAGHNGVTQDRA